MNTHHMVTLLTRSTVLKFPVNCIMQCSANNLYHGSEVTESYTVTMPQPTPPSLSRTTWLNIRSHKCCSPPIHHVTFFFSQRRNMLLRRTRFPDTKEIKRDEATLGCLLTCVSYLCPVYRHGHCLLLVPDENSCVPETLK